MIIGECRAKDEDWLASFGGIPRVGDQVENSRGQLKIIESITHLYLPYQFQLAADKERPCIRIVLRNKE